MENRRLLTSSADIADTDDSVDLPINDADNHPNTQTRKVVFLKRALLLAPITNAAYQAFCNGKTLNDLQYPIPVTVVGGIVSGLAALGLSRHFTIENVDEVIEIIHSRSLPTSWSAITKTREAIVIGITSLVIAHGIFSDGIQPRRFVDDLPLDYTFIDADSAYMPLWNALSTYVAAMVVINMAFGKGYETYRSLHQLAAGDITFVNRFSRYYSTIPGTFIGVAYAAQNALINLQGVIDALKKYGYNAPAAILTPLIALDALGDFCMNGKFGIDVIDKMVGFLNERCPVLRQILNIGLTGALSGITAYLLVGSNTETLKQLADDTGIEKQTLITVLISILTLLGACEEFIIDTATLMQPLAAILKFTENLIKKAAQKITQCCCPVNQDEINEQKPLLQEASINADITEETQVESEIEDNQDDPLSADIEQPAPRVSTQGMFAANYGTIDKEAASKRCCTIL